MNILTVFEQGDFILMAVFAILVLMSIITWTLIIIRSVRFYQAKKANKVAQMVIWHAQNWTEAKEVIQNNTAPMAQLTLNALDAKNHYQANAGKGLASACPIDEFLTRAIRRSLTEQLAKFESGLTALASIGATAPFIGLFGTVWGIYHALINISDSGQMNLAAVSGPIGEALIATAAGLATAIPAVLAYNALIRNNKTMARDMDHFAHDLHAQILTNQE